VVFYVAAVVVLGFGSDTVLPLFDGASPPAAYRWVNPPKDLTTRNLPPLPARGDIPLQPNHGFSVGTGDGQAQFTGSSLAFPGGKGRSVVRVKITPLDPAKVGPVPSGYSFDGNAYRIEATYLPSGKPAVLTKNASVILRYPRSATKILRWTGSVWEPLKTQSVHVTLQVFTQTREVGTFVPAGPPTSSSSGGLGWIAYGAAGLALLSALLAWWLRRGSERS
jgi:hypothetical protein